MTKKKGGLVKRRAMLILGISAFLGLVAGLFTGAMEKALNQPVGTQITNKDQPNQQTGALTTDTFQRADQPLWGRASDGHEWGGDANTKPFFSIKGKHGQIAGGQGPLDAVIIGPPTDNVDVTVNGITNQFGGTANLGVVLRWTDPNNWYKAMISGKQLSILKSVNGQIEALAHRDVTTSAGITQTLRFRSLGTVLSAKVWPGATTEPPNWILVARDQSFSTGQFGIRVFEQPTTVITILSFHAVYVGQ